MWDLYLDRVKTGLEGPPLISGASSWQWKTSVSIDLLVVDSSSVSGVSWLSSRVCLGRSEGETLISAANRLGTCSWTTTVSGSGLMAEHWSCLSTAAGGDRGRILSADPPSAAHTAWSHHLILVEASRVSESEDEGSEGLCSR